MSINNARRNDASSSVAFHLAEAICSLTLTFCDDNVHIDDVATISLYQRKVYATQLLLAALAHTKSLGSQSCF